MVPFLKRPALTAGLTALLLSMPAAALAQPVTSSPAPARSALARVWQQTHPAWGVPEPAWLAGGTARTAAPTASQQSASFQATLFGVSSVPASTKAWAVGAGCYGSCTVVLHYNGTSWSQVPSPSPGSDVQLDSVTALSDTDVWAVGDYCVSSCNAGRQVFDSLAMHWDGKTWTQVPTKNPSATFNWLQSVSAASPSDVWATGYKCTSGCARLLTLTEHWNGTSWSNVSSPTPAGKWNQLNGVSSYPAHKAWAVGAAGAKSIALRWTGTKWVTATLPDIGTHSDALYGVSAPSATNAWAVGTDCPDCTSTIGLFRTLALHWNGTKWAKVSTPNPNPAPDVLQAVAARAGKDAWAVGYRCVSTCGQNGESDRPLIIHWNGTKWSTKTAPGTGNLYSVSVHSSTSAWAVGYGCAPGCGALIEHWNGKKWYAF